MIVRTLMVLGVVLCPAFAWAQETGDEGDRHAGYYYPPPQTTEVYESQADTLPDTSLVRRVGFVTGMTKQILGADYSPTYAIFAKGDEGDKMIIVSVVEGYYDTLYRMRALLATLTAVARLTPFLRENAVVEEATFLDLLKLLGFRQLTVSDGKSFAHQIIIE